MLRLRCCLHCCDRKSWAACAQSFAPWQQVRATYVYFCSSRTCRSWWITQSTQHHRWGCNNIPSFLQRTTPIARALCEGWTPQESPHPGHSTILLRSEIPSGMCAKLRTVAASNNRDHPTRSLCYCLFAPHTYIFLLRAHPVRGESHNQRNTTGEVATAPPYQNFWLRAWSHISPTRCPSGTRSYKGLESLI